MRTAISAPAQASDWKTARAPAASMRMNAKSPLSGRRNAPTAAEWTCTAIAAEGANAAHCPSDDQYAQSVRRECDPGGTRNAPFRSCFASGWRFRNSACPIDAGYSTAQRFALSSSASLTLRDDESFAMSAEST